MGKPMSVENKWESGRRKQHINSRHNLIRAQSGFLLSTAVWSLLSSPGWTKEGSSRKQQAKHLNHFRFRTLLLDWVTSTVRSAECHSTGWSSPHGCPWGLLRTHLCLFPWFSGYLASHQAPRWQWFQDTEKVNTYTALHPSLPMETWCDEVKIAELPGVRV